MKYTTTIMIPKSLKINYGKALGELREHKRSGMKIQETQTTIKITIETNDLTALRASANSIIRDISVIESAKA